jgi:hypothetical protein
MVTEVANEQEVRDTLDFASVRHNAR